MSENTTSRSTFPEALVISQRQVLELLSSRYAATLEYKLYKYARKDEMTISVEKNQMKFFTLDIGRENSD